MSSGFCRRRASRACRWRWERRREEYEGWRLTHREAQAALLVAQHSPQPLTRYLDVALEAAALQDDALADSLIERYLLPLDDMRIGGQAARRTLRALFDTEYNVSSAAHPT